MLLLDNLQEMEHWHPLEQLRRAGPRGRGLGKDCLCCLKGATTQFLLLEAGWLMVSVSDFLLPVGDQGSKVLLGSLEGNRGQEVGSTL